MHTHPHQHMHTLTHTHITCTTHTTSHSLEEEWEYKSRERLLNTVLHANRLVQEANMLAEELRKETIFKVTLTVNYQKISMYTSTI